MRRIMPKPKKRTVPGPKKMKKMSMKTYKSGGGVKIRGTGAATKGLYARGPMA